jgi:hypothetical protein
MTWQRFSKEREESLSTIIKFVWVIKLIFYETTKWNYTLRMNVSPMFYFILHDDVAVLESMPWNSPLKNNLRVLLNVVEAPPYVLWAVAINCIYSILSQHIRRNHFWFKDPEMYLILSLNASATAPKYMRLERARLVLWDMNKKWLCFIFWDGGTIWDLNQINFFTSD